jgi:hypothetical protein
VKRSAAYEGFKEMIRIAAIVPSALRLRTYVYVRVAISVRASPLLCRVQACMKLFDERAEFRVHSLPVFRRPGFQSLAVLVSEGCFLGRIAMWRPSR